MVSAQLTTLLFLCYLWYRIVRRVSWQGFGLEAVMFSPGITWLLPMHIICLLVAKHRHPASRHVKCI